MTLDLLDSLPPRSDNFWTHRATGVRSAENFVGGCPTMRAKINPTDGIQAKAKVWRELVEDGTFDDAADHDASNGQGSVKPGWWNVGWIPLDADGGGNGSVVDTDPGENGVVGQVLDMDHEVGPSGPRFASVTEYLKDIADRIGSGALRWDGGVWEEF